jgi:predicted amidophosphoribosyltransferase
MEKLGVVLDDEKVKTASTSKNCPKCGRALPSANYCNTCGTEPFEKRPEKK